MPYRKLFLVLFLTSTLVLGAAWYLSLRTRYFAYLSHPAAACAVDVEHGTIGLLYFPMADSWDCSFQRIPEAERIGGAEERTSIWGKFGIGLLEDGTWRSSSPDRYVNFPFWFLHLVFNTSVLLFILHLKRRSDLRREMTLAAAHASASGTAVEQRDEPTRTLTYRKLFRITAAVSALGAFSVWWIMLASTCQIILAEGPGTLTGDYRFEGWLDNGSITLSAEKGKHLRLIMFSSHPSSLPDRFTPETPAPFGTFKLGRLASLDPFISSPGITVRFVTFPFWLPFLIPVGLAYVFTRVMEKRSTARREKILAGKHAAENAEDNMPAL